ncbi:MAG: hypothetical protein ACON5F_09415 [Jejuia sp.]
MIILILFSSNYMSWFEVALLVGFIVFMAYVLCNSFNSWKNEALNEKSLKIAELQDQLKEKQDTIDVLRGLKKPKPINPKIKVGKTKVVIKSKVLNLSNKLYDSIINNHKDELCFFWDFDEINEEPDNWRFEGLSDVGIAHFAYLPEQYNKNLSCPFKVGESIIVNDIDFEEDKYHIYQNRTITSIKMQRLKDVDDYDAFEIFSLDIKTSESSSIKNFDPENTGFGEWDSASKFMFFEEALILNPWIWVVKINVQQEVPSIEDILKLMEA